MIEKNDFLKKLKRAVDSGDKNHDVLNKINEINFLAEKKAKELDYSTLPPPPNNEHVDVDENEFKKNDSINLINDLKKQVSDVKIKIVYLKEYIKNIEDTLHNEDKNIYGDLFKYIEEIKKESFLG